MDYRTRSKGYSKDYAEPERNQCRSGTVAMIMQVSTATKIELVEGLVAAGLQQVEVTSFVSPKWVPQLADAAELCASISRKKGVKYPVLVPNLKASIALFIAHKADCLLCS